MNNRYLYQVGDKVRFVEPHYNVDGELYDVVGEIVELNTEENGDPVDKLNTDNPWYRIKWNDDDTLGWQHENGLVPEHINPRPAAFMTKVYFDNREYWDTIRKVVDSELGL